MTPQLIQNTVYSAEVGKIAVWLRRGLVVAAILGLGLFYLLHEFRGIATSQAMDQAQIGRELIAGHGWATKFIRPLAVAELERHGKDVATTIGIDTYNAPIPPLVDALALQVPVRASLDMSRDDLIYAGDRAIAIVSMLFFVASVIVLYFIALRLFDRKLALLACGLVLVSDMMWQYSLSGLPQMVILFFLHLTVYLLIRAIENRYAGLPVLRWLAAAGFGFGVLALTHALTIWIFIPVLLFAPFFFRPKLWVVPVMLVAFFAAYGPWLARNQQVCGSPFGIAAFSAMDGLGHSEAGHMRRSDVDTDGVSLGMVRSKVRTNLVAQLNRIFEYFGWSIIAPLAFMALLHPFKRRETRAFHWLTVFMWTGAVFGMAVFGISEEQGVSANQFHLLFIPLLTCYGLAYILVQWSRLEMNHRFFDLPFLLGVFLICGLPMIFTFTFSTSKWRVRWPPYLPPNIVIMGDWMDTREIIASDMPWAVAWYGNRRSVWVPITVKTFLEMRDFDQLGGPINGLYLTPVSGSENRLGDLLTGDYREWTPYIVRNANLENFPLRWAIPHGPQECVFFSNRDRRIPQRIAQ